MAKIGAEHLKLLQDDGLLEFADIDGQAACKIDGNFFWFGGQGDDAHGAGRRLADLDDDMLLDEAAFAIDGWDCEPDFADEHAFYAELVAEAIARRAERSSADADAMRDIASFLSENGRPDDGRIRWIGACRHAIELFEERASAMTAQKRAFDDEVAAALEAPGTDNP